MSIVCDRSYFLMYISILHVLLFFNKEKKGYLDSQKS